MKDLKGKGKLLVFKSAKPLQGHKESGDAAKDMSWEQGSNPAVLDWNEGRNSAGTWLETRLLQTKDKNDVMLLQALAGCCKKRWICELFYGRGGKLTWLIQWLKEGGESKIFPDHGLEEVQG